MKGRKPVPTARKRAEGNPGKRKLPEWEPEPPPLVIGEPPPELAGEPVATAEWRRLEGVLTATRVITEADRAILIAVCKQWALYLDANEKVGKAGLVVTTKGGYPIVNPYLGVANKALSLCAKLWAELGCTPSSRSRVVVTSKQTGVDPIDAALDGLYAH